MGQEQIKIYWGYFDEPRILTQEEVVGFGYFFLGMVFTLNILVSILISIMSFNLIKYSRGGRRR